MRQKSAVALLLLTLLCACSRPPPGSSGLTNVTIAHWGQAKILIYLPLYVAMDGGFFKSQGLNASLKFSGNDDQVFATVVSGGAQFGVGDPAFTVISRQRGGPGKVIAALVDGLANWGVAKDSKLSSITSFRQLQGLRISSFFAPSTTYTVLTDIVKSNHLTNTRIVQTAFGNELALLKRGEVDIAIMLEPNASQAEAEGNRVVWDLSRDYGTFLLTAVTTTDTVVSQNAGVCQKLVNALQQALNFCHSNENGTIDIAARNFPELSRGVVSAAVHRMNIDNVIPPKVAIDPSAWGKLVAVRRESGDIQSNKAAQEAIDNRFAENASR
jgi:NitT/TauT family transport system substrate-binding protein